MYIKPVVGTMALSAILIATACSGGSEQKGPNPGAAEKIATEGRASGAMPDGAFKATITTAGPPAKMKAGEKITLTVKVKNAGNAAWPAHGRAGDGYFQVNLGDNWFDSKNKRLEKHPYMRSGLPKDLQPGEEADVQLVITAPSVPGDYSLQIDLVQEMVAWFSEKGSAAPKFKVTVGG
jgi:Ig-like domain from next to BRCA1 gene